MSTLNTIKNGEVLVVYFTDTRILDDPRIQQIGGDLMAEVDRAEHSKLLLNFEQVKFMSSAMLGKLMLLNKKCKADGVTLRLCSITPDIMEVFKLLKLNKVLDIHPDEASALTAFEKKGFFS